MKKIIAAILTLAMVFTMTAVALADTEVTFDKNYTTTAGDVPATFPAETLSFTVTGDQANPADAPMITIADTAVTGTTTTVTATLPTYTHAGTYTYHVAEVAGNTQGVTYNTDAFVIEVLVQHDVADPATLVATAVAVPAVGSQDKVDSVSNKYDLGTLTVKKVLEGNIVDYDMAFDMTVTFTADKTVASDITVSDGTTIAAADWANGTVTKTVSVMSNGDGVSFTNIPAGVTYTVEEDAKYAAADATHNDHDTGYTVTYAGETGTIDADGTAEATVTNTKNANIDTGVRTDSMPYVMILAAVAVLGAAIIIKRRLMAK